MFEPWNKARAAGEGLLNANIAITAMGKYKNAKTTTAHAVNPRFARTTLGTEALFLCGEQDVNDHEHG